MAPRLRPRGRRLMAWVGIPAKCGECQNQNLVVVGQAATTFDCVFCGAELRIATTISGDGFVYVVSNPSMPGLVKIGRTDRNAPARIAELSAATGVPTPFVLEAAYPAASSLEAEAAAHTALSGHRLQGREFFRVSVEAAIQVVARACGHPPHILATQALPLPDLRTYGCRSCHSKWTARQFPARCPRCSWHVVDRELALPLGGPRGRVVRP